MSDTPRTDALSHTTYLHMECLARDLERQLFTVRAALEYVKQQIELADEPEKTLVLRIIDPLLSILFPKP